MANRLDPPEDLNVLALAKGNERYVWLYEDEDVLAAMRSVGRMASDPTLSLTRYDAAVLTQRMRQIAEKGT